MYPGAFAANRGVAHLATPATASKARNTSPAQYNFVDRMREGRATGEGCGFRVRSATGAAPPPAGGMTMSMVDWGATAGAAAVPPDVETAFGDGASSVVWSRDVRSPPSATSGAAASGETNCVDASS